MIRSLALVGLLAAGLCSGPEPLTARVDAHATQSATVGGAVELDVQVTNTGPAIARLGFVFRTEDRWYERHEMTDLAGCSIDVEASAFSCGDLGPNESNTYSFRGVATTAGIYHFELALRALVHPFEYVNNHADGADRLSWDEVVT